VVRQRLIAAVFGFAAVVSAASAADRKDVGEWSDVYQLKTNPGCVDVPADPENNIPAKPCTKVVPSAAALLGDGRVLLWSANVLTGFNGNSPRVHTIVFNPKTNTHTYRLNLIPHNMFCTGTTQLADGRLLTNGGNQSERTSIYDVGNLEWTAAATMNINRGYNANTILQDGRVLTIGGSWGVTETGGKTAEILTVGGNWRVMSGIPTTQMESDDRSNNWVFDSHFWLHPAGNGRVFHSGPVAKMHWLDTEGNGQVIPAGVRGDDKYAITATAVMFDKGKILKAGGADQYANNPRNASTAAYVIDINKDVKVNKTSPMIYNRGYVGSAVLPDGKVFIVGGQTKIIEFSNANAVLPGEMFDPETGRFEPMASIAVPRNYHAVALLLPDARVMSAGGGLCGSCSANQPSLQIFSPPYLFDANGDPAVRPEIVDAPSTLDYGQKITVRTDSEVEKFSIIRFGAATHTVNNDQRRLSLTHRRTGTNTYEVDIPSNPGWLLPGNWMLFAINANGTPSVAKIVRVRLNETVKIVSPIEIGGQATKPLSVGVSWQSLGPDVTFSGSGLPAGLTVNPDTGRISGTPTVDGRFLASIVARGPNQTISTEFIVDIDEAPEPPPPPPNGAPDITAPASVSALAGHPISVTVTATDPDSDTLTFSATDLPAGLSINPVSGRITGRVLVSGEFTSTVTVTDPDGAKDSASIKWVIEFGPLPAVTSLDVNLVQAGKPVSYQPTVVNAEDVTYLWSFGDGTTESTFTNTANRTHTFAKPGIYPLTIMMQAADGRITTYSAHQVVHDAVKPGVAATSTPGAALTGTGAALRLWVANRDNDSVSVIDPRTRKLIREIPTGNSPEGVAIAPNGRVWVVNRGSATISIIDSKTAKVVKTVRLLRGSAPYGITFLPNGNAMVSLEARQAVSILSPSGTVLKTTATASKLRHVVYDRTRDRVIASQFISPPVPGESTKKVDVAKGAGLLHLLDRTARRKGTIRLAYDRSAESEASGPGIPNYLGAAAISPDGKTAWIPSKKDNIGRGTLRSGTNLDFQTSVRAIVSKVDLATGREILSGRVDLDNTSLARSAVFHPTGAFLFVALETSREVAVVDPVANHELFRFSVGRAPTNLAISPDGRTLYVQNFMDRTVTVVDLTPLVTTGQKSVSVGATIRTIVKEKLKPQVLLGKKHFYDAADPRLARDKYMSCAVCHDDGESDGRTWDFTGFGEGLRNTGTLKGKGGMLHGFLHWSANFDEVQDFEGQIRNFAGGTGLMDSGTFFAGTRSKPLGDKKAGKSADLDALAAYVSSLTTRIPSPYRTAAGKLTASQRQGKALFDAKGCATCHAGPRFTISGDASKLRNIGTIDKAAGKRLAGPLKGIDVPTLRGVHASAPYLHDGSAKTIADAIRSHRNVKLTDRQVKLLSLYVKGL
jgi:YVTN family beta-propeller protein